ncbi:MAG: hypothetical protein CMH83_17045 [Nocardioides sp.]|nr:hypothetical protein [Nocardioides sp.]
MLVVQPVREVVRFLPALLVLALAGRGSGGPGGPGGVGWEAVAVLVAVGVGVARYLTTTYRIGDGRVELRRGLVSRRVVSARLDRVRSIDLTSSVVQRLFGLTTMRIGTGTAAGEDDGDLDLDGLRRPAAEDLRGRLLGAREPAVAPAASYDGEAGADGPSTTAVAAPVAEPETVARFDLRWLRFAPLTGTGLVVAGATFGLVTQVAAQAGLWERLEDGGASSLAGVGGVALLALLVALGVGLLLVVAAISVVGFWVTEGGYRLTREPGTWRVSRGLLTTRETSLDEQRVAGATIAEPLLLRWAGGRSLRAIVTGVDASERGSSALVPPSDATVAPYVAGVVLGGPAPVDVPLRDHGPAARARRRTRALGPAAVLPVAAAVLVVAGGPWWPLVPALLAVPVAWGLAEDRVRGLGHARAGGYVVARSGSLTRGRDMLAEDHVIGWNLRATWFQRRVGLTTLQATTAGGSGAVTVLDVPEGDALTLAHGTAPELLEQFLEHA